MGDTGAGLAEEGHLLGGEMDAVGQPHVRAEPAEPAQVLHGPAAILLLAVSLFVECLGQVGMEPDAVLAGQLRRPPHQAVGH